MTTRTKANSNFLPLTIALGALLGALTSQAATFTATTTGNWSVGATWGNTGNNVVGSGVPGASDTAIIPTSITVTFDNSAPATVGVVQVSGSISIIKNGLGGTFGDFTVNSGGAFAINAQVPVTFSGNFTNYGNMVVINQSQNSFTYYTSPNGFIVGNVTNQIPNITGSYQNLGTLVYGANSSGGILTGTGSLVNYGTILAGQANKAPTITTLDCSPVGSTFIWDNINVSGTPAPKAGTYYNLVLGNTGSAGWHLDGVTIENNLTVTNGGGIVTWPTSGNIGGILYFYTSSGGGASIFPATFSIGGLDQFSGSGTLTVPAGAVLTVTNTGATAWTRAGGTFTANATSTVDFTGAAPVINGSVTTTFGNLIIDTTATAASATGTAFAVNTSLTINAGGSLDVTALSGSSLTLGASASLLGSGAINGSIVTGSAGKVYAGTDGGYGTLTITNGLTMTTGSSLDLDVNSTAAATNDLLVVDGALTLNNTAFKLKAPSAGASIDPANDYTLVTAGNISGTPVLNWVAGFVPANTNNYSLVVSGGTIKLHVSGSITPPTPPKLSISQNGTTLTLSWDSTDFPGYEVQTQTTDLALGANWSNVGSGTVSPYITTINPAGGPVFFRLVNP